MNIGDKGLALLEDFEGCKLNAYYDVNNILTIGYGHTEGVAEGMCIDGKQASVYLAQDVQWAEQVIGRSVTFDLTQNEFDALVCLVYNIGSGNFRKSTLLRDVNNGAFDAAAEQFLVWDRSGGVEVPGLLRRRQAERDLFLSA